MKNKTLTKTEIKILSKTLKMIIEFKEPKIISGLESSLKSVLLKNKSFTEKEIKVIRLICEEYTNKEIGAKLGLSMKTIDNRRAVILRKTKSRNTVGVVKYAIKHKLFVLK
ncbi:MAG: hypothetical protein A3F72_10625 [Bacteroidetes bacterium RIFCSPLOWO2_12_FULL_35_15]|nr:MAG: hypothetical protein A3F72_10625 [Bacteroidetes bacterium RIFCSPLOWO2_12_FULL_35_15]